MKLKYILLSFFLTVGVAYGALETGDYIDDLVIANPLSSDAPSQGDDHLRFIKKVVKQSFPSISGAVTSTHTELNILDGVTSTTAELNILDGVTSTAAELNILDGVTSTAAELNILDGVTANTTELNYNDITTLGTVEASKTVTADGSGVTTNATLASPVINGGVSGTAILDEDDMASDSNTQVPTQQSVKAYVDGLSPITESYVSSAQTISDGTTLVLPHSLSGTPKIVQTYIVCTSAEYGYSIGDKVMVSADNGQSLEVDGTNVTVHFKIGAETYGVTTLTAPDTWTTKKITMSSWDLVVSAFY
jgi:hypothetical protein